MAINASSGGQLQGGTGSGGGLTEEDVQDVVSEVVIGETNVEGLRLTSTYDDALGKLKLSLATFNAPITNVVPASVVVKNSGTTVGSAKAFNFTGEGLQSITLADNIATIRVQGGGGSGTIEVSQDGGTASSVASLDFIGAAVTVSADGATITIDTTLAKSAYQLAVDEGFTGTLNAWLASLIGAQGTQGTQGTQGPAGPTGSDGDDGVAGATGQTGATGAQGTSVTLLGSVALIADLPASGTTGDGWIVTSTGNLYIWNAITFSWNNVGQIVGPTGDDGPQGIQGVQGEDGQTGSAGPQGTQGPAGVASALTLFANGVSQGAIQALNFVGADVDVNSVTGTITISGSGAVDSVNGLTGAVVLSSDEITEGTTNQYFTNSRFDGRYNTKTTDTLAEGSSNLYFTNTRFDSRLSTKTADNIAEGSSNLYFTNTRFDSRLSTKTSDNIAEGSSNLYHSSARARSAVSATSSGLGTVSYSSSTGVISYTGPSNTEIRSAFSATNSTGVTLSSGVIALASIPNSSLTNASVTVAGKTVALGASTTISVDDLFGVDLTTNAPISGQALVWDGSQWVPGSPTAAGTVSSVNSMSGIVVLTTSNITEGTNKYYTDARARAAISTSGWDNLSYNNSTGVVTITAPTTDNVTEGVTNTYYTTTRFDTRLATKSTTNLAEGTNLYYTQDRFDTAFGGKTTTNLAEGTNLFFTNTRADARVAAANLSALADVTSDTPTLNQVLKWNGTAWAPATDAAGAGITAVTCQVDYDASGNLTAATVLSGSATATITNAASSACEVTFGFTGASSPPLTTVVYGYQRVTNVFIQRAVDANFIKRVVAGGGSSGSPTAFTSFSAATNTMILSLTKSLSGASSAAGQTTHCVVQFTLV